MGFWRLRRLGVLCRLSQMSWRTWKACCFNMTDTSMSQETCTQFVGNYAHWRLQLGYPSAHRKVPRAQRREQKGELCKVTCPWHRSLVRLLDHCPKTLDMWKWHPNAQTQKKWQFGCYSWLIPSVTHGMNCNCDNHTHTHTHIMNMHVHAKLLYSYFII